MKGYPEWTKVTRIVEGGETPVFKHLFTSWPGMDTPPARGRTYNIGSIAGKFHYL